MNFNLEELPECQAKAPLIPGLRRAKRNIAAKKVGKMIVIKEAISFLGGTTDWKMTTTLK